MTILETPGNNDSGVWRSSIVHGWPVRRYFVVGNFLSPWWTKRAFTEKPERIAVAITLYITGMVGYALALPVRVAVVVKEIFCFVGAIFIAIKRGNVALRVKASLLCLSRSLAYMASSIVGVACPILAYSIDYQIARRLNLVNIMHGAHVPLVEEGARTLREANIAKKIQPLIPSLKKAVEELKKYYTDDSVMTVSVNVLNQTQLLGLLFYLKDHNGWFTSNTDVLKPIREALKYYYSGMKCLTCDYKEEWDSLEGDREEKIDQLIFKAVSDLSGECELLSGTDQVDFATKVSLISPELEALYKKMNEINQDLVTSARDFNTQMTQAAFTP